MRVPLSWLVEYLDLSSRVPYEEGTMTFSGAFVDEMTEALNELGMVVEGVERVHASLDNVVVAEVLEIQEIDGADHIRKILVASDEPNPLSVVCGAYNFEVGDKVPFAKVGAVLPGGLAISLRKMKGAISNGMLCSPKEVGLAEDTDGLMILPSNFIVGMPFGEAAGIYDDVVYDLAIEANRPDANCIIGVARDVAPKLGARFSAPVGPKEFASFIGEDYLGLERSAIVDSELAQRATLAVLTGPFNLKDSSKIHRRLRLAGMRPVSEVVDASNYAMLEYGFPSHPYDYDKIPGGGIRVRGAKDGEELRTLDGSIRRLRSIQESQQGDIVIADLDDSPIGLGGVMGGQSTEVTNATSRVLIELVAFNRSTIARTSKRLSLRSEASMRFERGVDPGATVAVLHRICDLMGTSPSAFYDFGDTDPQMKTVVVRVQRVQEILGVKELDAKIIASLLAPIGFEVAGDEDVLKIKVPTFRPDCESEIDIIEEIARHFGYKNIQGEAAKSPYVGRLTREQKETRQLRLLLRDLGFHEAITSTLYNKEDHVSVGVSDVALEVSNPLNQEEIALRMTMLPGHLKALSYNLARRLDQVDLFELGSVVSGGNSLGYDGLPNERVRAAILVSDSKNGAERASKVLRVLLEFFSVDISAVRHLGSPQQLSSKYGKFPLLHRGRRSGIFDRDGQLLGVVGELSPKMAKAVAEPLSKYRYGWLEFDIDAMMELSLRQRKAQELSSYTSTDLDLSFELPELTPASELIRVITETVGDIVKSAQVFDVFRSDRLPQGMKSIAIRLRLERLDRSLNEEDVRDVIEKAGSSVSAMLQGTLRDHR